MYIVLGSAGANFPQYIVGVSSYLAVAIPRLFCFAYAFK